MTPSAAIEHLITAGMTEKAIGASVGAGQSTINRIRHGRMHPAWAVGDKLVRLAQSAIETAGLSDSEEDGDHGTGAAVMGVVAECIKPKAESARSHGEQHRRAVGSNA